MASDVGSGTRVVRARFSEARGRRPKEWIGCDSRREHQLDVLRSRGPGLRTLPRARVKESRCRKNQARACVCIGVHGVPREKKACEFVIAETP